MEPVEIEHSQIGAVDDRRRLPPEYSAIEAIGAGGHGQVFKAYNQLTCRYEAVKILAVDDPDEVKLERMKLEASILSRLDHANIVKVYKYGVCSDGTPCISYEFLDGMTLDMRLKEKTLSDDEFRNLFKQLLLGLDHAHGAGVIHRDVKPSNIMLVWSPSGTMQLKILDFGIAKFSATRSQGLTQEGAALGSPEYMSPEQCRGAGVDERSDLYSVGCIMYCVLSGHPPFSGDTPFHVLYKQMNEVPPPLVNVSPAIVSIVMSLLEKDPARRPASAQSVLNQLTAAGGGLRLQDKKRHRGLSAIALFLMLVVAACSFCWFQTNKSSTPVSLSRLALVYRTLSASKRGDPDEKFQKILSELESYSEPSTSNCKFGLQYCKAYLFYRLFTLCEGERSEFSGKSQTELARRAHAELQKALALSVIDGKVSISALPIYKMDGHVLFHLGEYDEGKQRCLRALELLELYPHKVGPKIDLPFSLEYDLDVPERLAIYHFLADQSRQANLQKDSEAYARLGWQVGRSTQRDMFRWETALLGLDVAAALRGRQKYGEAKAVCDSIKADLFAKDGRQFRSPMIKAYHLALQYRWLGLNRDAVEVLKQGIGLDEMSKDPDLGTREKAVQELATVEALIRSKK